MKKTNYRATVLLVAYSQNFLRADANKATGAPDRRMTKMNLQEASLQQVGRQAQAAEIIKVHTRA